MKKLLNKLLAYFSKPEHMILVVLLIILIYLTIVPLFYIGVDTFTVHSAEVRRIRGSNVGDFTLYHWEYVFNSSASDNLFYKPLINTLLVSVATCAFALIVGGFFAWMVTRTDLRFKKSISTMMLFPYIMPSWTLAMAWLNFFKNKSIGGVPGIFSALTGIETADWFAYGFIPIVLVLGMHYAPFAFILIGGILRNMDANLEEAAVILKTSRLRIIWKITVPIVMPAILSTFLLVFSSAMSAFAVPSFLGGPVRYQVLTTQLYRTINGVNPGAGYIIASFMIVVGVAILTINQIIIGKRKGFTTVTGKSGNISLVNLRKLRTPVSTIMLVILVAVAVIPLMTFAAQSFFVEPGNYSLSNLSTIFWTGEGSPDIANGEPGILKNKYVYQGLFNSFSLSIVVALIAGTVGILVGYSVAKTRGKFGSNMVDRLAFFPYLIPSMAFGAIYLSMFSVQRGFIPPLYGTFAILALVGSVKYLPFASRAGINAILQLGKEIEEAAIILGVKWWKRMLKIIIPIQKPTVISGYLLPFISSMRELALYILLVTPGTSILTTMLFKYNEKGWNQYANAIVLLIIGIVLIFNFLINKVTGASLDKGIGG
ncbi:MULTISPECIES: iron ABC transporter permease [Mesotoga]|uniref:ABC transporter permease n=2 Tax=Kosmotogaceae TaxID=1643948 RepID=UPI0002CBE703|nr:MULTISPECIES: iron ABC transporter permease [Mesotoga]MCP5461212.1 iron ABC transporter permease [Thermotogota bacterium]CCU85147.1 Binding-protein-dependent transport systems inner membrane component [Mesotoga infera]RLL83423.1 ABC transporter permease [Mesotoga sp. H07pep.5.4]HNQ71393.1 iron ABC transporter permease [Mesotoga prima]HNS76444.1 iron ABC transporter permease [Mesotoga prima]